LFPSFIYIFIDYLVTHGQYRFIIIIIIIKTMLSDAGHYGTDAVADAPGGIIPALQILTHISIFFSANLALVRGYTAVGTYGLFDTISSLAYHSCRSRLYCFGLDLGTLRFFDHVISLCYGASLILFAIQYPRSSGNGPRVGKFAMHSLPFVCLWAVAWYPFQIRSALLVMLYAFGFLLARVLLFGRDLDARQFYLVVYRPWHFLFGTLSLLIALGGYLVDTGHPRGDTVVDGLAHSLLWHLFSGIALSFYIAAFTPTFVTPALATRKDTSSSRSSTDDDDDDDTMTLHVISMNDGGDDLSS
jgi:hypothetical protein